MVRPERPSIGQTKGEWKPLYASEQPRRKLIPYVPSIDIGKSGPRPERKVAPKPENSDEGEAKQAPAPEESRETKRNRLTESDILQEEQAHTLEAPGRDKLEKVPGDQFQVHSDADGNVVSGPVNSQTDPTE